GEPPEGGTGKAGPRPEQRAPGEDRTTVVTPGVSRDGCSARGPWAATRDYAGRAVSEGMSGLLLGRGVNPQQSGGPPPNPPGDFGPGRVRLGRVGPLEPPPCLGVIAEPGVGHRQQVASGCTDGRRLPGEGVRLLNRLDGGLPVTLAILGP